ncbi:hypothetical protein, partial [Acetobacter pasteurianus]|uniref:hypothetical protein n=1 Tax=Acetobacter pasteurianus TaxID=438 RepID=UPI001BDFB39E
QNPPPEAEYRQYSRSGSCGMTEFYKITRNCLKCEKSASIPFGCPALPRPETEQNHKKEKNVLQSIDNTSPTL